MTMNLLRSLFILLFAAMVVSVLPVSAQSGKKRPEPRLIQLDPSASDSMDLFTGPPGTVTMRSGYMVLAPGKSVGKHSTRTYEEAVIVLAGSGEMKIAGGATIKLKPYSIAYCPPATEHDVVNTGTETLRYIWLVAKASR